MPIEIELPDGTVLEAPDDADPSVVAKAYLSKQSASDPFAGDELLSNASMSQLASGQRSTVTPSPDPSPFRGARKYLHQVKSDFEAAGRAMRPSPFGLDLGSLETAGTMLTGGVVAPVLGTAESMAMGTPPEESFNRYTYQPRTESGQAQLKLLGSLTSPLTESGADIALFPLANEMSSLRSIRKQPKVSELPIPTTEELKAAKNAAYKAGDTSSVLTSPEQNAAAIAKVDEALRSEHLVIDPDLHPKSTALLRRLHEQRDKPLTVPEAESLRQLALEVQRDIDPVTRQPTADAYRAGVILDELDGALETLSVNVPARELNTRYRRSQLIDEMIRNAEIKAGAKYTQAGMEHALRQEFKSLALNPRRMRGLSAEQRSAVEKVAKGGSVENSLRALGKFDPTSGGMAALVSLGSGTLLTQMTGGPLGLALPVAGFAGKRLATSMTKRNVDAAREALVGRGQPMVTTQVTAAVPQTPTRGLLGAEDLPVQKGLLGAARSAEQVRQELRALDATMQQLPAGEPLDSPRMQALSAELARLRAELAAAESRASSP